jgi:hypothetical protein
MNFWQRWGTHRMVAHARARVAAEASTVTTPGAFLLSDHLPDSPVITRVYCPGCEPSADPIKEALELRYCDSHTPKRDGADDDRVVAQTYLSGSAEAGGEENAAWCARIHRGLAVQITTSSAVGSGAPVDVFGCG